jgi:very-short-patch-repair endonuclease
MIDDVSPKPKWKLRPKTLVRARTLRKQMTDAERVIWYAVRAHRLDGVGFRRQVPIGPYIVDFASHGAKLVVEIDGGQHYDDAHEAKDARRDAYLKSVGFRVLRFNNRDVLRNRQGVLAVIAAALGEAAAPSLTLPGKRGRGQAATGAEAVLQHERSDQIPQASDQAPQQADRTPRRGGAP